MRAAGHTRAEPRQESRGLAWAQTRRGSAPRAGGITPGARAEQKFGVQLPSQQAGPGTGREDTGSPSPDPNLETLQTQITGPRVCLIHREPAQGEAAALQQRFPGTQKLVPAAMLALHELHR